MVIVRGIGAVAGLAVAKVFFFDGSVPDFTDIEPKSPDEERERFAATAKDVEGQLNGVMASAMEKFGSDEADVFDYQLLLLQDEDFLNKTSAAIDAGNSAESAVDAVCREYMRLFSEMDNDYLRQRTADIDDIKNRLLCSLLGKGQRSLGGISGDVVLVAEDLTPSQMVDINDSVKGIILGKGGKSSHTVVLARSRGIPCVVGLNEAIGGLPEGSVVIMDGKTGEITANPTKAQIKESVEIIREDEALKKSLERYRHAEAVTRDGFHMNVFANMAYEAECGYIINSGAGGVGLLRTEFFYMSSGRPPTEEEQYKAYSGIASALGGKPLTVRTLDIGGDKHIEYLGIPKEENPFLGFRAIRYCLENKELFKKQIAAALRAALHGRVEIMFPMIATVAELRGAKAVVEEVKNELKASGVPYGEAPVGIMIETPAAACMADILAKEADFFSIGTNDLTQYMFAADRGNDKVAYLNSYFDPALLRAVNWVCKAAAGASINVDICGQAGEVTELIPIWAAMGVNALSVSIPSVPRVKKAICETDRGGAKKALEAVLNMSSASEAADYLARLAV